MSLEVPVASAPGAAAAAPARTARSPCSRGCRPDRTCCRSGATAAGDGLVMVGVGNDQFAIVTQPIAAFDARRCASTCRSTCARSPSAPTKGRAISSSRSRCGRVDVGWRACTRDMARHAVRYGDSVVYLPRRSGVSRAVGLLGRRRARHDGRAHAGSPGAGARDPRCATAPVENHVHARVGRPSRGDVALKPGEERRIEVPLDPSAGAALLRIRIRSAASVRRSRTAGAPRHAALGVFVIGAVETRRGVRGAKPLGSRTARLRRSRAPSASSSRCPVSPCSRRRTTGSRPGRRSDR